MRYAPDGDRCRLCDFITGHDAHLIAARPAVVPSQSDRRLAIARGPRLPRWLRQPRQGVARARGGTRSGPLLAAHRAAPERGQDRGLARHFLAAPVAVDEPQMRVTGFLD